jgi:hypothetical protein
MASAGEMTPPTGGRNPSWARGGSEQNSREQNSHGQISYDKERSDETRSQHVYAGKLSCSVPATLALPEERG